MIADDTRAEHNCPAALGGRMWRQGDRADADHHAGRHKMHDSSVDHLAKLEPRLPSVQVMHIAAQRSISFKNRRLSLQAIEARGPILPSS